MTIYRLEPLEYDDDPLWKFSSIKEPVWVEVINENGARTEVARATLVTGEPQPPTKIILESPWYSAKVTSCVPTQPPTDMPLNALRQGKVVRANGQPA